MGVFNFLIRGIGIVVAYLMSLLLLPCSLKLQIEFFPHHLEQPN